MKCGGERQRAVIEKW